MLTLGSLFDGIAGFPESARRHGIKALWASEIEPFPIMVSKAHFPGMEQKGSVIDINGAELEPVDIVTFGSPCQDLSVAGKREGLDGERSHLFFEAVDRINEMRKRTHKCYPSFAIWENVPGALSSNGGRDFRAVLEALTEAKIPMPPSGRWAESGMVRGNGREVAWRCLDAQYWGVPQRRKRIFLVVDFGGDCASEILFEPEGLLGDSQESGKARKEAATCAGDGTATTGRTYAIRTAQTSSNGGGITPEIAYTLDLASGQAVAQCVTTRAGRHCGPETETLILADQGGNRIDVCQNVAPTLRAQEHGHQPCVIAFNGRQDPVSGPVTGALDTDGLTQCIAFTERGREGGRSIEWQDDLMYCLTNPGDGGRAQSRMIAYPEPAATLRARGKTENSNPAGQPLDNLALIPSHTGYAVRRLTPLECERLQGLPDGWTDINIILYNKKGKPRPKQASDTARYKAIGNGLAIVCPDWLFQRMNEVLYSDIQEVVNQ